MLAQLSAFELLQVVLIVGFISALSGWVGGTGARLIFSMRLARVEQSLFTLLNRSKGAAGQAVAAVQRQRATSREAEAEQLAAQLSQIPRGRKKPLDDEEALDQLEARAVRQGLKLGS